VDTSRKDTTAKGEENVGKTIPLDSKKGDQNSGQHADEKVPSLSDEAVEDEDGPTEARDYLGIASSAFRSIQQKDSHHFELVC
jgi:hypothetical protein